MPVDVFDREVKASIEDLRAALVGDVAETKKDRKERDENTEQLKKLNDNLEKLVGAQLDKELKSLNKLIKKVADCCEEAKSKRSAERQAKAFGQAAARALGGGNSRSLENSVERMLDRTMTFGKALENSQRRFATAFGMIGKDFKATFGDIGASIKRMFSKLGGGGGAGGGGGMLGWRKVLDSITGWWRQSADAVTSTWNNAIGRVSSAWQSLTSTVAGYWNKVTGKIGSVMTGIADKVSGYWNKAIDYVSKTWIGKTVGWIGKTAGFLGRSVATLGKATVGSAKNFLGIGKPTGRGGRAGRDVDDMMGEGVIREGDEGGVGGGRRRRGKGGGMSDLCRCICECIGELTGVTKDGDKKTTKLLDKSVKGDKRREFTDKASRLADRRGTTKTPGGESQAALKREWMQDRRRENWARKGAGMKSQALGATSAASRFVFSDKPMESLLAGAAAGTAKVTGKVVEGPIAVLGDLIQHSTIPVLSSLGPVIKAFGSALGGLAEGLVNFVLTPLIEQVEIMDDATKAMYISTGATQAAPRVTMPGKPGEGMGEEWADITKRVVEANNNMDSTARTLEKLGTYMNDVAETGQRFTTIQKTMLRNFKRGIQDTKALNKVTKTGLQTAYLLGASAESTADLFADWHQRLGMSTTDLRGMQRNMTQIARSTGIFGDELVQIAKSSHQFMENMRMAGNLSTTAAKNIVELTARGRKTGTEGATGRILDLLSKGILRGGGGPKETALATIGAGGRADLAQHALQGTLLETDEGMKDFANNLENWTRKLIGADPTKSLEENIKKLTPAARARFTAIMEQTVGVGLNEMAIVVGNLKETSKSFNERIEDMTKAARGPAMTLEQLQGEFAKAGGDWQKTFEKLVGEAKGDTGKAIDEMLNMANLPKELRKTLEGQLSAQQAEFQKQQLFLKTGADLLDEFNKNIADGGKGFDKAIADLGKNKNFREYLDKIGADAGKGGEAIQKAMEDQAARLTQEANKLGKGEIANLLPKPEEIREAIVGKDAAKLSSLTEKFTRVQGMLAKQGMQASNPVEDIKQNVHLIEGYFKELLQSAIYQMIPFLSEMIKQLQNAPFWKAFREGDIKKGIELLGEFIGDMAGNIEKAMAQVGNLTESTGFQKFVSGVVAGIAKIAKPLMEALGNYIKENAGEFTKFVENMVKLFKETDWHSVGIAIGVIVGALVALGTAVAVGGVLALGLAAVAGGLGSIVMVLGAGALVYGLYELSKALKDLDKAKADLNKTVQKQIEMEQKRTEKSIDNNKDAALAGNVSALEARRAALLREEAAIVDRIEKNKDKKEGMFGQNAEEVAQLGADRARKAQIDKEKAALDEQMKIAKAKEAEQLKNLAGRELANKQMEDYWNNSNKRQVEAKALQDKLQREKHATDKRIAELDDMWTWTRAEKREREEKAMRRDQLNEQLREAEKNQRSIHQSNAQRVYDTQWAKSMSGGLKESSEEKYIRQRYGLGVAAQREQGIKDRDQLGQDYSKLADILWKDGPEGAMAYIKENSKKLNADIVNSMLEVYGAKLPVEMAKNLKTTFAQGDFNALKNASMTAKMGDITPEQFLKARELSRKRGQEAPDITDLSKVISNPDIVKLSKEQLDYLQRSNEVLKAQIEDAKRRHAEATLPGAKSILEAHIKGLEELLAKSISESSKKQIAEMEKANIVGPQMPEALKETEETMKNGQKPGSIYTHDTHLEELMKKQEELPTVNPRLPGSSSDAETQIRKEKAELQQQESDMSVVEGNTGTTAAASKAQVKLLSKIGKLLAKAIAGGGLAGLAGPDYPTTEFMEDILSTEWPGARPGRTVGLEIDQTDIA